MPSNYVRRARAILVDYLEDEEIPKPPNMEYEFANNESIKDPIKRSEK